jgi:hypothetical protein
VANSGAEQNDFTGYTRRRHMTTAVDGGSIPPISTIGSRHTLLSFTSRRF